MTASAPAEHGSTPGLARRLACFTYEGVLLFGVLWFAGYVYGTLTQQRHALVGTAGLQVIVFLVLAVYFVWFWTHGGQTLAMKTWDIRLVDRAGLPLTQARAFARYLAAWMWFLPALALIYGLGLNRNGPAVLLMVLAGVAVFAALAWLRRDRQFWHDAVCGTRLVNWRPAPAPRKG